MKGVKPRCRISKMQLRKSFFSLGICSSNSFIKFITTKLVFSKPGLIQVLNKFFFFGLIYENDVQSTMIIATEFVHWPVVSCALSQAGFSIRSFIFLSNIYCKWSPYKCSILAMVNFPIRLFELPYDYNYYKSIPFQT